MSSPRQTEVLGNDLGIGQATAGPLDAAITQGQLRDVRLELFGREFQELLAQIPRGSLQGKPHEGGRTTGAGGLIVGSCRIRAGLSAPTSRGGRAPRRRSVRAPCAPWPISTVPASRVTLPSACMRTRALATEGASGALMTQASPRPARAAGAGPSQWQQRRDAGHRANRHLSANRLGRIFRRAAAGF